VVGIIFILGAGGGLTWYFVKRSGKKPPDTRSR